MNNGFVKMWDNWSKRRSSVPVYDFWLDEYKNILQGNKENTRFRLWNRSGYFIFIGKRL